MNLIRDALPTVLALHLLGCSAESDVESLNGDYGETKLDDAEATARGPALYWPRVASGDRNQNATVVEYLLQGRGEMVAVDGTFDATVDAAVRRLQTARGLVSDGIVGEQTWLVLVQEVARGNSGPAVRAVQYLLKNRHGASLDVTGELGPTTETRIKELQKRVCLEQTGIVGRYTWNALVAERSFCADGSNSNGTAAQRILEHHTKQRLTLWNQTFGRFDGADPLSNITAAATGRLAKTSCYGNAPCTSVRLSNGLLNGMAGLRERYGFNYFVPAIAGADHGASSYHFVGRAVDFDEINGVRITGDTAASRSLMNACREMGAIEVLGPSNDAGHQDHIHCAW